MVETGGDDGQKRARHTYEKLGFGLFPVVRYFKKLWVGGGQECQILIESDYQ